MKVICVEGKDAGTERQFYEVVPELEGKPFPKACGECACLMMQEYSGTGLESRGSLENSLQKIRNHKLAFLCSEMSTMMSGGKSNQHEVITIEDIGSLLSGPEESSRLNKRHPGCPLLEIDVPETSE